MFGESVLSAHPETVLQVVVRELTTFLQWNAQSRERSMDKCSFTRPREGDTIPGRWTWRSKLSHVKNSKAQQVWSVSQPWLTTGRVRCGEYVLNHMQRDEETTSMLPFGDPRQNYLYLSATPRVLLSGCLSALRADWNTPVHCATTTVKGYCPQKAAISFRWGDSPICTCMMEWNMLKGCGWLQRLDKSWDMCVGSSVRSSKQK